MKAIASALVNFHANLKPIKKDAQNPFFKSDYLTLSGILDEVRPQLCRHGLAIVQSMKVIENGNCSALITSLIHISGESINSEIVMPIINDPQKMGSLITYYKRYQLQAMLGISTAEEDDDGNSVSIPEKSFNKPVNSPTSPNINQNSAVLASEAQKNALKRMGIAFQDKITKAEASKLIEQANKR